MKFALRVILATDGDTTPSQPVSKPRAWLMAARPKTLPAAVAPVIVGSALAYHDGVFAPLPALAALAGALLFQIAVNFANDYFDYVKGIDTADRLGPTRVTASGLIAPGELRLGLAAVLGLALLVGAYLVSVGGWPVAVIGLASIFALLAYSGGPFPLASHGLGDLTVFIFFGLAGVCGTYYVQARALTPTVVVAALPVGALITAILVVNNLRDIDTDRRTGKRTLAVILGARRTRLEYAALVGAAYLIPGLLWAGGAFPVWVILPWGSLVLAWRAVESIYARTGPALNTLLADTARLTLIFSVLLAVGFVVSAS
ncbi:MAG: 1,4-dihydroxy-2-naphthoate polyprenyltransferase [Anaerolineae bacterium]|nr:1,4-dihydroxy-2-naphthoate polyprenyltransferase [Anaerolineae bacterium]